MMRQPFTSFCCFKCSHVFLAQSPDLKGQSTFRHNLKKHQSDGIRERESHLVQNFLSGRFQMRFDSSTYDGICGLHSCGSFVATLWPLYAEVTVLSTFRTAKLCSSSARAVVPPPRRRAKWGVFSSPLRPPSEPPRRCVSLRVGRARNPAKPCRKGPSWGLVAAQRNTG